MRAKRRARKGTLKARLPVRDLRLAKNKYRTQVLVALQSLTENFVRKVCVGKGMPEHIVKNSGGKIFTYGSYRLGVYGPGNSFQVPELFFYTRFECY